MSLSMGQAAIAGTVAAFTIPPGACSVTVYSAAATTLYLGTNKTGLTASNGYAVSTYPTTFGAYNVQRRGHRVRAEHRSDNPCRQLHRLIGGVAKCHASSFPPAAPASQTATTS